jgi:hypothetical protein
MKQNLITLKIKYSCDNSILNVISQYNSVLKFTYNRLLENPKLKTSEITKLQKNINNCDLIGSHLRNSAIYDAKSLVERSDKPIVFGGKHLFKQRCQHKITKEEFLLKRLRPISSIGEANQKANRLFDIVNNQTIIFKLNKQQHFKLNLQQVGSKRLKELNKLIELQNNKQISITYKLDLDYVYLTFDYNLLKTYTYKVKQNRVIAIDLNPNSIGWSIVDWLNESQYNVIQSGTFSLKSLNDYRDSKSVASNSDFHKYITNKRNHEIIHVSKELFTLCKYYNCEVFSLEDLNIKSSDKKLGHKFNKLVNNTWNRNLLVSQIKKHINSSSTTLIEVQPQYNSYIGNLVFRQEHLPDECLASIEIGRRGFEFATQYIFNRRPHQKTVIYPKLELVKNQLTLSLEELGVDVPNFDSWKNILSVVKESKVKYRFSTSEAQNCHSEGLFSKFYKQKYLMVYKYL